MDKRVLMIVMVLYKYKNKDGVVSLRRERRGDCRGRACNLWWTVSIISHDKGVHTARA